MMIKMRMTKYKNLFLARIPMKILAFTDIHASSSYLKIISRKAQHADILICCGDFTLFMRGFAKVINALRALKKPVLILHGNHEDETQLHAAAGGNIISLHRQPSQIGDYLFLGHGGGGFALIDKALEKRLPTLKKYAQGAKKLIFITHGPPFGTELDYLPWAEHVGCRTIKEAIRTLQPHLYLCGHLHENFRVKQQLGRTLMINPGPEGVLIEI
jgi:Icc-related predicted phosphoesterase